MDPSIGWGDGLMVCRLREQYWLWPAIAIGRDAWHIPFDDGMGLVERWRVTRNSPASWARYGGWRHWPAALAVLLGAALLSWWVLAGSTGGWFAVGAQVISSRDSRDALDAIPLPSPLRDGSTATALPRFHTFLGTPEQAALFYRERLPAQGFTLEKEWWSRGNAMFQIWRRGNARVHIAMQAPYSGPPQPTRIGLDITPFAHASALP